MQICPKSKSRLYRFIPILYTNFPTGMLAWDHSFCRLVFPSFPISPDKEQMDAFGPGCWQHVATVHGLSLKPWRFCLATQRDVYQGQGVHPVHRPFDKVISKVLCGLCLRDIARFFHAFTLLFSTVLHVASIKSAAFSWQPCNTRDLQSYGRRNVQNLANECHLQEMQVTKLRL